MCFGGGDNKIYNAYDTGDFGRWQNKWNQYKALNDAIIGGDTSDEAKNAMLVAQAEAANLENNVKRDSGAAIELRNAQNQYKVGVGKGNIDKAFTNFNDNYYTGFKKDYTDYYNPQLEDQYTRAQGKANAALANKGMGASTVAGGAAADLLKTYNTSRTGIANEAQNAADKLKGNVENTKSSLYALNQSSADPEAANTRAIGEATALVAPATHSPLGQVFASALQPITSYMQARGNRAGPGYQPTQYRQASRTGSGRVVSS